MGFHVRDFEADGLARELARLRREGTTDAVKSALKAKLAEERRNVPPMQRIKGITDALNADADPDFKPDRAFYDWLSGEEDP
jgi:antitoxin VapB